MEEDRYILAVAKDHTEAEWRDLWDAAYCRQCIVTFDGIRVHFYNDNFDHAFFESSDRRRGVNKAKKKDILSMRRLSRFYWIKDVLRDPDAELHVGYDSSTKSFTKSKRVAIVRNDYVVVIQLYSENEAKFITAFVDDQSIDKIKKSPLWK